MNMAHPISSVGELIAEPARLPAVVGSFNGFYGKDGVYVLCSQSRILMARGFVLIVVLLAC
jgi:hypothetical protein